MLTAAAAKRLFGYMVLLFLVCGSPAPADNAAAAGAPAKPPQSDPVEKLVDAQILLLLTQETAVDDHAYPLDCTGTVMAAYEIAGAGLFEQFVAVAGGGVARLYTIARDHELLRRSGIPQPGDVLFWDNTFDANGDGQFNDELTHAGLVLATHNDGSIEYVHHNYRRGIVVERMNLLFPEVFRDGDGTLVNSPMRMAGHRYMNPDKWLASHLFRGYAPLHELFD